MTSQSLLRSCQFDVPQPPKASFAIVSTWLWVLSERIESCSLKVSLSLLGGNTSTPKNHHLLGCQPSSNKVGFKTSSFSGLTHRNSTSETWQGKGFQCCHVSAKIQSQACAAKNTGQGRFLYTKRENVRQCKGQQIYKYKQSPLTCRNEETKSPLVRSIQNIKY